MALFQEKRYSISSLDDWGFVSRSRITTLHKRPKHQSNIAKIIFYRKIVKTRLYTNNEVCNNKKRAM